MKAIKTFALTSMLLGAIYVTNAAGIDTTASGINQFYMVGEKDIHSEIINHALKGKFHVELPAIPSELYAVTMYDSLGRVVYQSTLPQNKQNMLSLNIQNLPKGKYYLKIKSMNKACAFTK
jgi:hypothetical protein